MPSISPCIRRKRGGDPVARFHLDNGARLERLNLLADLSPKGVKQSFAMMVNYLDDLDKVEAHHEKFVLGEVAQSRVSAQLTRSQALGRSGEDFRCETRVNTES